MPSSRFDWIKRVKAVEREYGPPSRTRDLLESVGARCKIPDDWIRNAHHVRDYRNVLIHEREEEQEPVSIARARSHLCCFLSKLPLTW